jgi:transposase
MPGLLAHLLAPKYSDHLLLHRQRPIFAPRQGVELYQSKLANWVGQERAVLAESWLMRRDFMD